MRRTALWVVGGAVLTAFAAAVLYGHAAVAGSAAPRCALSTVRGDFDGDGRLDRAAVYVQRAGCDPIDNPEAVQGRYRLTVSLATGARLHERLPECDPFCHTFAAPDLNRHGRHELAIRLVEGASTSFFAVYVVAGRRIERTQLAPPGDPDFAAPGYFQFPIWGSITHWDDVVCRTARNGAPRVVVAASRNIGATGRWRVHETRLAFDEAMATFSVVGLRNYTTGSIGGLPAIRGSRCIRPVAGV
ncbi:MAG TPA: hypothetical protein VE693_05295 [Gaiellaceae bacterium]|jgi:hypothetical protein|nr:hypothetical protein [Gaiellaceae bacterium]